MHDIEPFYRWREHYVSSEDPLSPFYDCEYDEFNFSQKIYNFYIHPQWDNMGSTTLFIKIIFADYEEGYAFIELIGEWNDTLHNDIMILKRDIADHMMLQGISKFVLIGENVLNFHASDDCYYEEWFEDVEEKDGWIALLNFRDHVLGEISDANVDSYFVLGGQFQELAWRTLAPKHVFQLVEDLVQRRIGI